MFLSERLISQDGLSTCLATSILGDRLKKGPLIRSCFAVMVANFMVETFKNQKECARRDLGIRKNLLGIFKVDLVR